ncbi:MAG: ABC transporter permease/M1 family aminopeptidase, partial [Nannocystaceae bacterium]
MAAAVGHMLGSISPFLDPQTVIPINPAAYAVALVQFVLPNFFVMGALAFCLATLTRKVLNAYIGLVVVWVLFAISQAYLGSLDNQTLAAMCDPFGIGAWAEVTRYWSVAEKNHELVPLTGTLLYNRLLYVGLGAICLALTHNRFRLQIGAGTKAKKATAAEAPEPVATISSRGGTLDELPEVTPRYGNKAFFSQYLRQVWSEFRWLTRRIGFTVLVLFGVFNVIMIARSNEMFGTHVFPVTRLMLDAAAGGFSIFLLAIITVYSGAMVWREREAKMGEIFDALPLPGWVPLAGKFTALALASLILLISAAIGGVLVQLSQGFMTIEPLLYIKGMVLVEYPGWLQICALAFFIQVLVNHKYLGFGAMVFYFLALFFMPQFGLEHKLLQFGSSPPSSYSDMNGYGHFVSPVLWFHLYWMAAGGVLMVLARLFWVRGTDPQFRLRAREARRRLRPAITLALATCVAAFVGCGSYIYYNTNVLNTFATSDDNELRQAEFERKYKKYEFLPQPRIAGVNLDVQIYPKLRKTDIRGTMKLVNRTDEPIADLHLVLDRQTEVHSFGIDDKHRTLYDADLGYSIYKLPEPLAPGAEMELRIDVTRAYRGFVNSGSPTNIVYNGTFFNHTTVVPSIGYSRQVEIGDPETRRKYDLPERPRMYAIDNEQAKQNTYIAHDSDWIDFEAKVTTDEGQIALAPGYLQTESVKDGRHMFHYKMDAPILNFYSFLSADYDVARDTWNDVAIEIYHHGPHDYNVDKMIKSTQASLEYYSTNFSPYQHRQVRILEFPGYATFAQAFPNTIPYSEGIGFIANLRDPDAIDYVFYVTAHEVAHQWWAHQVIGADVQGATVTSETLAQYSALMVMEKEYGRDKMRRFLKYELDRYLRGRGRERIREVPLVLVENQPYIRYRKGSLVMYALREYIGEDNLNRALAAYIKDVGFQRGPFTTSRELLAHIRAETPDDRKYILEDWFETITLYDNRTTDAKVEKTEDGRFKVTVEVEAHKFRADDKGNENEVKLDDFVQIGVLGQDDQILHT